MDGQKHYVLFFGKGKVKINYLLFKNKLEITSTLSNRFIGKQSENQ